MKTVFIVNPCAGKKRDIDSFIEKIHLAADEKDVEIYVTTAVGDATQFVRKYCNENGAARFIACGGDGTLGEVVNGAVETPGCEVGVIPMGTGNDFCRNFDCDFSDIFGQINGKSEKCDVIRYTTTVNGVNKSGYCVNMFNIGFDCNVVDMTDTVKRNTLFRGSVAYFIAILVTLIKKKVANLKIELDGKTSHDGKLLLTSIANGCYCGGGVKSNPLAHIKDGLININIIKNVSRLRFITLLPSYMKGTVLKIKGIEKVITSVKCDKITLAPKDGNMRICIDGEITDAEKTEFSIVHNGLNFVVPKVPEKEKVIV